MSKGFEAWNPRAATMHNLKDVLEVMEENRAEWPLSQRYWVYRLMAKKGWLKVDEYNKAYYPKAKQLDRDHKNLNLILDRGRRAGLISWDAVESKRGEVVEPYSIDSPEEMVDRVEFLIREVQFDRQRGQVQLVVLWCETEGLIPLVEKTADHYGAPTLAGKGFDVIGKKHDFAERVAEAGDVLILHLGDLDKSGHTVHVSLMEDLSAFVEGMGGRMNLKRIGMLESQVYEYGLEYAAVPATKGLNKGNHGKGFTSSVECQLEAMDAPDIRALVSAEFEKVLDMDLLNARIENEAEERRRTAEILLQRL